MVDDINIVTIDHEQEVIYGLSNSTISGYLEWPSTSRSFAIFKPFQMHFCTSCCSWALQLTWLFVVLIFKYWEIFLMFLNVGWVIKWHFVVINYIFVAFLCVNFSWPCLHQWLETRPNRPMCPVCKAGISKDKVIPLYGRGNANQQDPRWVITSLFICFGVLIMHNFVHSV